MSVRASTRVQGRRETLLRFQSGDSSELLSAWSLVPVTWEQSPAEGGDIMQQRWDLSNRVNSSASKAAAAGKGGSGRGCFGVMLKLLVELEENIQGLEVCQKALYALVKFTQLQVT